MAKQFTRSTSRAELNTSLAAGQLDENLLAQPDTVQIVTWLSRLHLLYGIPFNYLVPDIRMLPDESIRFFQVDENWITSIIDGAFSPGTTLATNTLTQALRPQVQVYVNENLSSVRTSILNEEQGEATPANLSGFFLRSSVVNGWPGMEIAGYSDVAGTNALQILRMERISPSLLLCLFNGIVARVEMSEPAETLHFGFNTTSIRYAGAESIVDNTFYKTLRYVNSDSTHEAGSVVDGDLQVMVNVSDKKVLNINALAAQVQANAWAPETSSSEKILTSAEFALTMVENTDFVTFTINT